MVDNELTKYSDKRSYNNLPVPEGQYLAPFLVHNWDEVKAMNYHRENLETWHFSGIAVLVAFTPVTAEQFPGTMKLFWSDVRTYIADLKKDPNILSYDKMLEDMMSEEGNGYDPAQTESLENTTLLGLIIDDLGIYLLVASEHAHTRLLGSTRYFISNAMLNLKPSIYLVSCHSQKLLFSCSGLTRLATNDFSDIEDTLALVRLRHSE